MEQYSGALKENPWKKGEGLESSARKRDGTKKTNRKD